MNIANAVNVLGLGPRLLQQDNQPMETCNDMFSDSYDCNCCKIVPCKLCLEWELPDGYDADSYPDIDYGIALPNTDGTEWIGFAGGISFRAYIDPSYCTINIELNGYLEYTASLLCLSDTYVAGYSANCRDFSDEIAYTDGSDEGIFRWIKKNLVELAPVEGFDSYGSVDGECADFFCGTCTCTCEQLCVELSGSPVNDLCADTLDFSGTYCYNNNKAGTAEWSGGVTCANGTDALTLEVFLTRDTYGYGNCIMFGTATGTLNGESVDLTLEETEIGDCGNLAGIWTFTVAEQEYTITLRCVSCGNCSGINSECCPDVVLSEILYVDFNQIAPGPPAMGPGDDCSCAEVTVPLYGGPLIGLGSDESYWESALMGYPCPAPPTAWKVVLSCSTNVWTMQIFWYDNCVALAKPGSPVHCNELASTSMTSVTSACDPFELTFADASPGDMFPSAICTGGITPAEMEAIITE